ncbi:hypothetical protein BD414DRAFT_99006 [Trametes punicea]|nr:hypothetical protein BD414DRAFT_99006 [Trametes punicea]
MPEAEDNIFDITLPLPSPPCSPSKRPQSRGHYDVEMSPSKRSREGALTARKPVHFEERGLLFGNATNAKAQSTDSEDVFDLGTNAVKPMTAPKKSTKANASRAQVEVVLQSRRAAPPL